MKCEAFGQCGSCTLFSYDYEGQLGYKVNLFRDLFEGLELPELTIIRSQDGGFRTRAEFRIWKAGEKVSYAMRPLDGGKEGVCIASCSIVDPKIDDLMPRLIAKIEGETLLKERLFEVNFLTSCEDKNLVTLIYHKKLNAQWEEKAQAIALDLGIKIIGRSRGQKVVLEDDFVIETLMVAGERYAYRYIENSFTQPNRGVNEQMVTWVCEGVKMLGLRGDLVELYCGAGNFTIPLSRYFRRVLATEISKASIAAATHNCTLNRIENIDFMRLSSEEFVQAITHVRPFRRLAGIDLESYDRTTLFVDPPRAGLDETTRELASGFETIIYISCSPQTLRRDLETLLVTHKVVLAALFDQFPYTTHLESGVILQRR